MEGFEQFVGVNFWTMIFAWCNLVILYLVLRKILFKPIMDIIQSRKKEVDDMYGEAESNRIKAEEYKNEYEKKLVEVEAECEEYLRKATKKAQMREEEIIKEAEAQASHTIMRANEQIELERKRVLNEAKNTVSEMAVDIAEAIIQRDVDEKEHSLLIDDFISRIGDSVE